jgi:hypothetical protein
MGLLDIGEKLFNQKTRGETLESPDSPLRLWCPNRTSTSWVSHTPEGTATHRQFQYEVMVITGFGVALC